MVWTQFWDMHSGGSLKEASGLIYVEAPEAEAGRVFYARFGHAPDRVTCTCCGSDYSVRGFETLEEATGYHRGCRVVDDRYVEEPSTERYARAYQTLESFLAVGETGLGDGGPPIVIRADEITDAERDADVPEQGWVWQD